MKPQADGSTKIITDPKWFDEILDDSSHRETPSVREDLRFQVPLRARFLKAFGKPSRPKSHRILHESGQDYALEALANITNPHAPYSVRVEQMLIARTVSISPIGKKSLRRNSDQGGQNLLMDLNRIMSGPREYLST